MKIARFAFGFVVESLGGSVGRCLAPGLRPMTGLGPCGVMLCGVMLGGAGTAAAQTGPGADCDAAGMQAEQRYDLPGGLLRAIGRVESGRRDPGTGQVTPWPWAINAEGRGRLLETREDVLAATRSLQSAGVVSIDVGCFQVNLMHHPQAFASLEAGFDPQANADYAARFLVSLRAKTGSWEGAVAAYHSATPELGGPYRDRVLATWRGDSPGSVLPVGGPALAAMPIPLVVRMVTWNAAVQGKNGEGMRIWTPSARGQGAAVIRLTRG